MPGTSPNRADAQRLLKLRASLAAPFPAPPDAGSQDVEVVRAPGCVNLMGDHTEDNDGLVLPVAVGFDAWLAYRRRRDGLVQLSSAQDAAASSFWIDDVSPERRGRFGSWSDYVEGMAWSLREAALPVRGLDGVVDSIVPTDAGLGWSAALELAAGLALLDGARLLERPSLAALAQRAERDYAGLDGGIMDAYAGALGLAGRAILLDCRSLESRYVTLPPGLSVVVCDTGWRAPQRSTPLAERRAECGRGGRPLATGPRRGPAAPPQLPAPRCPRAPGAARGRRERTRGRDRDRARDERPRHARPMLCRFAPLAPIAVRGRVSRGRRDDRDRT